MDRRFWQSALLLAASAVFSASSLAHHSLASFDISAPLWIKGTVVRFERVNPHSVIFLDERTADGRVRRWAVDGPSTPQLERQGLGPDFLKPGEALGICGFATKEGAASLRTLPKEDSAGGPPPGPTMTGQVLQGTLLVMPDGKKRVWSDYGQLSKCISPEEQSSLTR